MLQPKTSNAAAYRSKINSHAINSLMILSVAINIGILVMLPNHFSFLSAAIIVPTVYTLIRTRGWKITKSIRFSAFSALAISLLYATLLYYWASKGSDGCAGFFGVHTSCLTGFQRSLVEVFAAPVAFFLVAAPLLNVRESKKY